MLHIRAGAAAGLGEEATSLVQLGKNRALHSLEMANHLDILLALMLRSRIISIGVSGHSHVARLAWWRRVEGCKTCRRKSVSLQWRSVHDQETFWPHSIPSSPRHLSSVGPDHLRLRIHRGFWWGGAWPIIPLLDLAQH